MAQIYSVCSWSKCKTKNWRITYGYLYGKQSKFMQTFEIAIWRNYIFQGKTSIRSKNDEFGFLFKSSQYFSYIEWMHKIYCLFYIEENFSSNETPYHHNQIWTECALWHFRHIHLYLSWFLLNRKNHIVIHNFWPHLFNFLYEHFLSF